MGVTGLVGLAVTVLPALAKLLGLTGKTAEAVGDVAGVVEGIVRQVTGTDDAEAAARAVADPATRATLLIELGKVQAEAEERLEALRVQNLVNARGTMVELARLNSVMAWAPLALSLVIVMVFAAAMLLPMFGLIPLDDGDKKIMEYGFIAVIGFWIGSSAGSKRSGDSIRSIAEKVTSGAIIAPLSAADALNEESLRKAKGK